MESNSPPRPPPFADNFGYKLDYIPPHSPFPPSTLIHPLLPLRCWTLQVNFIANFQVSFRVNQSGNCMQIARLLHPPRPPPPPPPPQQTPPPPQQQNEHKDILFQFHNLIFIHFLPIFFPFSSHLLSFSFGRSFPSPQSAPPASTRPSCLANRLC